MAKGDHIQVRRLRGLYYHHGIDMGDGTVIHFSGEPLNAKQAKVCQVSEEEFLKGEEKQVVVYGDADGALEVDETLALAREQLERQKYHVFFNNCEHFSTYCKTKKKMSRQVESFAKKLLVVAGTASAVAVVLVTDQVIRKLKQPRA